MRDISSWNVSKILNMQVYLPNYLGASSANYPNSFNQDISGWSINPSAAISNLVLLPDIRILLSQAPINIILQ